jgi:hypothetical protein
MARIEPRGSRAARCPTSLKAQQSAFEPRHDQQHSASDTLVWRGPVLARAKLLP